MELFYCYAYGRLSKEDGDKIESDSIKNQRDLIHSYIGQHPELKLVMEGYDDGYTGTNFERPYFKEMLEAVKEQKVNCVIVKDLSRFGREYIEAGRYIEKLFPALGVRFIAINDGYDTAYLDASSSLILPFKNLINDSYCRDTSIKVRSHFDVKRRNGEFIGSFAAYGYSKDPKDKNRLVVDPEAADVVREIFARRISGMSCQAIADELNTLGVPSPMEYKRSRGMKYKSGYRVHNKTRWSATAVRRILQNEVYLGVMEQGKRTTPNYKVKTVVYRPPEEWMRVEDTVRLLKANGIGVYFEKENINTLTESSEFLITLFSGFAQAESESLSKNVAWGKQKSAEAGKVTFQYKKMLGYRKGADGQPEIVPEEAEIIRRIYHRYLNGCTLGKIKRELEEDGVPTAQGVERWSPSIIHNILTNEKYIGDALLQKTYVTDCINKKVKKNRGERTMYYVENSHPAIVSRDLFNQVQQEMTRRSSKRKVLQKSGKTELGKYSGKYALTELLVCGECGSPYKRVTWARNGEKRIVWRCVSRLEFGTKYCQHSPTLDEGRLHSAILAAMNEYAAIRQEVCPDVLAMAEEAKQALSQAGARLLQLKKRMDAVSREQSDVLDRLLVNMADTELNARMKALTDEKESLKAQIADAQQAEVNLEEQAARRRQMWDSIMECAAGYTEFDNELVRQVIQKITVEDAETIHIHFRDSDVVLEQEVE